MFRDVTTQKQAQDALLEALADAQRSKTLLEGIIHTAPIGIGILQGKDHIYKIANEAFMPFVQGKGNIIGKSVVDVFPEVAATIIPLLDSVYKTGKPYYAYDMPFTINRNGRMEYTYFTLVNAPWFNETGKIEGVMSIASETTRQVQLDRQKDDFLGVASHELKTPVTSIKAYTQVLERMFRKKQDFKAAELLTKMDGQINKLTKLISDLLDVTKIEAGKMRFKKEAYSFNNLVSEIVEEVQRIILPHSIEMHLTKDTTVVGDRDRVGQVITNLLTNAAKYSPQASMIKVISERNDDYIILSVCDYGLGVAQDLREKIFQRFFRASGKKEDTYPGLGLGLYISKEIIKRQGGKIWVDSDEGKGSKFSFRLPLQKTGSGSH